MAIIRDEYGNLTGAIEMIKFMTNSEITLESFVSTTFMTKTATGSSKYGETIFMIPMETGTVE